MGDVKTNGKRKVRKSFLFVLAIFVMSIFAILSATVLFPINIIEVNYSGNSYEKSDIISASKIVKGDNIIMLSGVSVKNRVTEKLPYIGKLKVKKTFPDKIILTATECSAAYCTAFGEKFLLLDKNFKALEKTDKPDKKVCCLYGTEIKKPTLGTTAELKNEKELKTIKRISMALKGRNVNYIDYSDKSNIVFFVNKKFKVKLGTTANIDEKLEFMSKMIKEIEEKNQKSTGTINLLYFKDKNEGYFTREKIKINYFKSQNESNNKT